MYVFHLRVSMSAPISNTQLVKECDNLKKETKDLRKSKQELQQDVEKKEMEKKKLTENSNLKSYQRVSNELAAAQIKLLNGKVAFRYETLDKAFKELIDGNRRIY